MSGAYQGSASLIPGSQGAPKRSLLLDTLLCGRLGGLPIQLSHNVATFQLGGEMFSCMKQFTLSYLYRLDSLQQILRPQEIHDVNQAPKNGQRRTLSIILRACRPQ